MQYEFFIYLLIYLDTCGHYFNWYYLCIDVINKYIAYIHITWCPDPPIHILLNDFYTHIYVYSCQICPHTIVSTCSLDITVDKVCGLQWPQGPRKRDARVASALQLPGSGTNEVHFSQLVMADAVEIETMKNYNIAFERIDPSISRYPYCIVWTPIPVLSWVILASTVAFVSC